ncbi:choice-of-anchor D domain-containing protein [Acidicapsa acidisoli]|uniref:choice-of-anchor D domain-containing protein n=1 Tax=Acidicapsa acidisoli TaxID=1615681 RepID=UPI0021DF60E3|nr:choice-of-anchor D domain-containing protein [Acidicapsa acidisoli]
MRVFNLTHVLAFLVIGIGMVVPATAQSAGSDSLAVPSRVVEHVEDAKVVTLAGNVHPMARKEFDKGRVEPGKLLERVVLVLKRSPEQEAALAAFNERQYDPKSADFHHWLHAEEFGRLYGPSDADVTAVTSWLQNHGFEIYDVNKGRTMIQFSGTAAQVQEAFQVEMHRYQVNGEAHIANDRDPSIPEALAPVVTGIASLHDFFGKPQHVVGKYVRLDPKTGKETLVDPQPGTPDKVYPIAHPEVKNAAAVLRGGVAPQLTYAANGDNYEDLTPYDFATIYNILPLWTASSPINGKGVTIAISGVSDISQADVTNFRSTFGLPAMTLKTIVNGTDPGADGDGGQLENSLDVEMSGATAPGAQIVMVVSSSTATTGADMLSDEYIIDNEVAHIMSASYGECELELGTAGNSAYNTVWQQGATEGISIFESAGDQGSAGCTSSDQQGPNADKIGLQVNGMASSPFVTAVGGTDFTWSFVANGTSTYWNSTDGPQFQTAKGIMPEVPWNSTCTNPLLDGLFGAANPEQLCNGLINYDSGFFDGLIVITGGSGGISHCTQPTGTTSSTCAGGYAKPSWQTGYGSSSTNRDVPDVSLFASGGFPSTVNGSAILLCDSAGAAACSYTSASGIEAQQVGGTSASSPLMAGVMALVVQKTGAFQGLANPAFYKLYANQKSAGTNCNSSTVANGNSCIFYDVTQGTNAQVCITGDPNCVTNTSGDPLGILSGFAAGTGYDDATGLGTLNVTNLVNNWSSVVGTTSVTLTPTSLTFPSTTVGVTSATQSVTLKNTGTSTITLSSETLTGADPSSYLISAKTCSTTLAAGATCTVSIEFKPTATGTLTASLSVADNATGSPQAVALSGTGVGVPLATLSPTSLTFASTTVGVTTAAQVVTVKNSGTAALALSSETITGTGATSFLKSATTCGTSLAVGATCTVSVEFKPLAAGALTASLAIADNATGSPQAVALSGTGVGVPTVTLSPTSLTFASTTVGATTAAQVVTVKNSGTAALTLTSETLTGTGATSFVKSATTCGTSLAVGATCTVSVEFKPLAAGALTASLSVADNATGSPQAVALSGTGVGVPAVTLSPTSLTFASTTVGVTTAAQVVTVKNSGTAALTLSSETITGTGATSFLKSATTCGTSLAVGATCTVSVEFKPLAAGALTASLSVVDNATGSPQAVALSGTGVGVPAVTLSPTSLTFASTTVGVTTAAQVVTVKNSGTAALTLTSETLTGTDPTSFVISAKTCGTSLAVSATCTVSVEFKPVATGALTASLAVADNATGSPQKVALSGTGVAASTPTVTLTPTTIAFPATVVGVTSDAQIVTLKNTGTVAVTVSSIALGGTNASSFEEIGTCGTSLAAGASCSLYVAFKPVSAAALSGTLSVTDNATGSPQKVTLTGTGTTAPSVKLSTTSLSFPTTTHGTTSAAQAVTLTNGGTATLTLTSITLTGTNPTDFEELNTCGATLAPAASCVVYVAFHPAAAAAYKATLSISDSGALSPQSVTLAGTGN